MSSSTYYVPAITQALHTQVPHLHSHSDLSGKYLYLIGEGPWLREGNTQAMAVIICTNQKHINTCHQDKFYQLLQL